MEFEFWGRRRWARSHAIGCRKSWWSGRWIRPRVSSIKSLIIFRGFPFPPLCFSCWLSSFSLEWFGNRRFVLAINWVFGLVRWVIEVNGAPDTLYAGEMYQLQVDFPEHYPMEAPQVLCFIRIRISFLCHNLLEWFVGVKWEFGVWSKEFI